MKPEGFFFAMNRNNNFDVKGWMVLDYQLKGNELMAFAIVFGFSQDGLSEFKGSLSYLMKFLSVSKPTASKILNTLCEKNLIEKRQVISDKGKRNFYRISEGVVKKLNQGGKETLPWGGKETLPLNIHKENIQGNIKAKALIDFPSLLKFINQKTGREFKVINNSVKQKYLARLKDGYKKEDIIQAIESAISKDHHKANGFQYLTPEFFSRSSTLEKYASQTNTKVKPKEKEVDEL